MTHSENWCPTPDIIESLFRQKFSGVPKPREGTNTDHAKGKSSLQHIKSAYDLYGFDFQTLSRVWCCWSVRYGAPATVADRLCSVAREYGVTNPTCAVLSLRDDVIPALINKVGTSNYDDDVLRMLSLLEQKRIQTAKRHRKLQRRVL